ncbi:MAG: PASTA domain-containing protein [Oscillospiraceae bacterium]
MHNRKRDTKAETSQIEGLIPYVIMVVLLFTIVAGCIAVTVYLKSNQGRETPKSNNMMEYFPTETASTKMEATEAFQATEEVSYSTAISDLQEKPANEGAFETAVIETLYHEETVSEVINEEIIPPLPEIVQENKTVVVPDYTNQDGSRTEIKLQSAGFHVDRKYEYNDNIPVDAVIRTEPNAGEKIEQGSKICVVISQGSEMISVQMPNLVGKGIEEGKTLLQPYGVRIQVTEVSSPETVGTILSQSIPTGETLEYGANVELTVSKGEEKLGTVTYIVDVPSESATHFVLDFFDENSNHIASSGFANSTYNDHAITVTLEGKGTQKVYVMLQNVNTGLTAEVGSYNFYYDDGSYAAIDEDILLAFEEVNKMEEMPTETLEIPTEMMETVSTVQTEE